MAKQQREATRRYVPIVNRARCEGKAACVEVCPYNVFEVGRIETSAFRELSWSGRMKVRVHGMKTAYTVRAEECHACGLCVATCPENAIKLVIFGTAERKI